MLHCNASSQRFYSITLPGWYAAGELHPHISHTLPLERAGEALELLHSRKSTGKVVVTV